MIKTISTIKSSIKLHIFFIILAIGLLTSIMVFIGKQSGLKTLQYQFLWLLLIFILCIICISLIWWLVIHKEKQLLSNAKQPSQTSVENLSKSLMSQKIKRALEITRSSRSNSGFFKFIAQSRLPWFILMGQSSSGKSTLLHNAMIHFPFTTYSSNTDDIQTSALPHVEFWFANNAVFIDTQRCECGEDLDNLIWLYFLKQVNKYRNTILLRGIIYVIDIEDIIINDESKIKNNIAQLRREIDYVSQTLGYYLPIYLVFNKMDCLTGFKKFLQLNPSLQQDMWGIDINHHNSELLHHLQCLYERFSNRIIDMLSKQLNCTDKIDLLNLSELLRCFIVKLNAFIILASKENPYQMTPRYSGVYLTSANHSYGVNALLSNKLIECKTAIERTPINRYHVICSRVLCLCVGCALIVTTLAGFISAYSMNSSILKNALILTGQSNIATNSSHKLINQSDNLRNLYNYYDELNEYPHFIPWYQRLGLYKGNVLIRDIQQILFRQMTTLLMKPMNQILISKLQDDANLWQELNSSQREQLRGNYYAFLKYYLMLHFPQRLDINYFDQILHEESPQYHFIQLNDMSMLPAMINFYLKQLSEMNIDAVSNSLSGVNTELVTMARSQLNTSSALNNIYAQLRDNGISQLGFVSLQNLLKMNDETVYMAHYQLPKLYTKEGWQEFMLPQIVKLSNADLQQNDWVMVMPIDRFSNAQNVNQYLAKKQVNPQIINQLQQLYFNDYAHAWIDYLNNIHIQQFNSLDDTTKRLQLLSEQGSVADKLYQIISSNLSVINRTPDNEAMMNANYLQSLAAIQSELEPLLVSADAQRDALLIADQIMSGSANNSAIYHASLISKQNVEYIVDPQLRQALLHVLLLPVQAAWRNIMLCAKQSLEQHWQTDVIAIYQQKIANKSPFVSNAEDATLDDVIHFFNADNGLFFQFVDQQLAPFLNHDAHGWHEKTWLNLGLGFSKEFIKTLEHMQNISNELFDNHDNNLGFTLNIYPEPTPGIDEICLIVNGQEYRYRNEPQRWQQIKWQAQDSGSNAILKVIVANNSTQKTIEFNSAWGILQLLHRAEITQIGNATYHVMWHIADEQIKPIKVSMIIKITNQKDFITDIILHRLILPNNF